MSAFLTRNVTQADSEIRDSEVSEVTRDDTTCRGLSPDLGSAKISEASVRSYISADRRAVYLSGVAGKIAEI